jgi:threonine synthase
VRGKRLLQAIRENGGTCIAVDDAAILEGQRELAQRGLFVEPTSATVVAALDVVYQLAAPGETILVPLTGSGLKGSPRL